MVSISLLIDLFLTANILNPIIHCLSYRIHEYFHMALDCFFFTRNILYGSATRNPTKVSVIALLRNRKHMQYNIQFQNERKPKIV